MTHCHRDRNARGRPARRDPATGRGRPRPRHHRPGGAAHDAVRRARAVGRGGKGPVHGTAPPRARRGATRDTARPRRGWRRRPRLPWVTPSPPSTPPPRCGCCPTPPRRCDSGELSGPQVKVIAHAAQSDPGTEKELLQAAATRSFKGLTARAAEVRAAARSAQEEHDHARAIHRAAVPAHLGRPRRGLSPRRQARAPRRGPTAVSAEERGRLRFNEARKASEQEPPAAYLADALVALVAGEPVAAPSKDSKRRPSPGHGVHPGRRHALRRGHVDQGRDLPHPRGGPGARGRGAAPAL